VLTFCAETSAHLCSTGDYPADEKVRTAKISPRGLWKRYADSGIINFQNGRAKRHKPTARFPKSSSPRLGTWIQNAAQRLDRSRTAGNSGNSSTRRLITTNKRDNSLRFIDHSSFINVLTTTNAQVTVIFHAAKGLEFPVSFSPGWKTEFSRTLAASTTRRTRGRTPLLRRHHADQNGFYTLRIRYAAHSEEM